MSPQDISLGTFAKMLPVRTWWAVVAAVVAVLVGAVGLGTAIQSTRVDAMNAKLDTSQARVKELEGLVTELAKKDGFDRNKMEFLERFVAYKSAPGDASRITFTSYVCALFKQAQERNVRIVSTPLSPEAIRRGLSPELKRELTARGVPPEFFDRAERGGLPTLTRPAPPSLSRDEAVSRIQKAGQGLSLDKIVTFYDGTTFTVPPEIAYAVHTDPKCQP